MLRYNTETRPGLVDIWPGNRAGPFLQPRSPHGAQLVQGWWRSIVGRTLVSAGELSLSCARLLAGWVTDLWLRHLLSVSQHGQLSLPSLLGQLMSNNPCYSGLWRQTAEGVVRGVAYRPRQRVLLAARLEV